MENDQGISSRVEGRNCKQHQMMAKRKRKKIPLCSGGLASWRRPVVSKSVPFSATSSPPFCRPAWLSIWCGQPSAEAALCSAERLSFLLETACALAASAPFCARSVDEPAQVDEKFPLRGVTSHCGGEVFWGKRLRPSGKGKGAREKVQCSTAAMGSSHSPQPRRALKRRRRVKRTSDSGVRLG